MSYQYALSQCNADFKESQDPTCVNSYVYFYNISDYGNTITFFWDFGSGAVPATSTAVNPPPVKYTTPGQKTVTLYLYDNGSLCDIRNRGIDVAAEPNVSFTSTAPQCAGTGIDFTYTGDAGLSYQWDFGKDAYPATSFLENPQNIVYSTGGTKTVTLIMSNGICEFTVTQNIDINNLPAANAGKDTTICADRSVQIGSSSVAGYSYSWFPSNTLSDPAVSDPVASPIASITKYTVTVVDGNGCQNSDSVTVSMLDPLFADAGEDAAICVGDFVQIGSALIEGQSYSWMPADGLDDPASPAPIASPDTTTIYTLAVNGHGCDTVYDNVEVIVYPLPDANAGIDDTITTGASVQLTATGGVQYEWSPFYGLDNPGVFNPVASPEETTEYTVEVTDIYGCKNTDDITITVLTPSLWIPNAFTPDDNGKNDVLFVRGEGMENFEFKIFDRWGHLVFYSSDINIGWDGKKQVTNEIMPAGAYVYVITGTQTDGTEVNINGVVNLIR